jgi:hypothetical protein
MSTQTSMDKMFFQPIKLAILLQDIRFQTIFYYKSK